MSNDLSYDMTDIDDIFDQMELQVVSSGGWSGFLVNLGMGLVIAFSVALYCKMRSYESKNS